VTIRFNDNLFPCIVTELWAGQLGFNPCLVSTPTLGPNQPLNQWVPGLLSLGVKRPERKADHSPPSSAEVKECVELYLHSPIRLHGVVLS